MRTQTNTKAEKTKRIKPFVHTFTKGERRGLDIEEMKVYISFKESSYDYDYLFTLIPLHKYNKISLGSILRGKTPLHGKWTILSYDTSDILLWMQDGNNIGVRIGGGLLVIDVDLRNYADGIDSLEKLQSAYNFRLEDYPFVETGGGGYHIYMLIPEKLNGLRESHPDYPGIDFKTSGQVVAAGSVHPNGITYEWGLFSPPLSAISRAPGKLIELLQINRTVNSEPTGIHTPEQLEKMLEGLNPEKFRVHREWLLLMMACHHATAGDGIEEFVEWSISDPYYANYAENIRKRWDSLNSNGTLKITYKTLYKILHLYGKDSLIPPPKTAEEDFEAVTREDMKE